jgi:CRP-like cAMP-binding protein
MAFKDCEHRKLGSCLACPSRNTSIFANIAQEHLKELDESKVMNLYKKGQVLFDEGSPALGVYCVLDGQVKILKNSENGKETITRLTVPGDVLGLRGVLSEKSHPATAKVMEDSHICFIDRNFFKLLIQKSRIAGTNLIFRLVQDVTKLEERMGDMAARSVRQRLTQLLVSFCQTYGKQKSDGIHIDLKITRAEIASMIGSSSETIIRTLSDMDSEGIIRQDGKKIIVPDLDFLIEEAGITC